MSNQFMKGTLGNDGPYATALALTGFSGRVFVCDWKNGSDGNDGSFAHPFQSLAMAFTACLDGNNDVIVIISDGATDSSQRISSTILWNKKATHLIGVCSGDGISNRARIAPAFASGSSGPSVAAFTPMINVSVDGCYFENIEFFHGFTTGEVAQICLQCSGGRNVFRNIHFAGMGDTTSAGDTGSRAVVVTGTGENLFDRCTFGVNTISRGVANATVELAGGTPRNVFRDCIFELLASASSPLHLLAAAASAIDRETLFFNCAFLNSIQSTATTLTGAIKLAASAGGAIVLDPNSFLFGATSWGADATSKGQIYVTGSAASSSQHIGINPA